MPTRGAEPRSIVREAIAMLDADGIEALARHAQVGARLNAGARRSTGAWRRRTS
ncbi:hypothetical protein ACU686_30890 [Yinghuangia aomiensis]